MAQRRMFSNRIANSARFLQMPAESQLLYFHMILRADDDGIVESYPLMKLLGLASDNFKVLIAKNFIQELNEDQVIVIMDWLEHNTIRSDRKINSIYLPLLLKKCPEIPFIEPKPRSDVEDNSNRLSGGQPTGGISKVRLGKVKLSKYNISKDNRKIESTPSQIMKEFISNENNQRDVITKIVQKYNSDYKFIEFEIKKFISYWTELNKSGTKQRWELEKTFELTRRLSTWLRNTNKFQSKNNKQGFSL